ncbi:MAG: tRNA (adenosine(37)-N6)-dimethylallyltransferase MiaA [Candidatus Woykebacteria bacterium RBG_16_39_9b]|uniref:tRNA dimethylallyltransferase n=1 Tax=Candidatus Woykebacteria bacterium RBG_16_39_9b TaxID=1802595 RepID=A0A1G1WDE9_9BACT|nr:MAG: tRNA (adenosine(37)-N6)-dimethylallyltransferase MiaA [Candidatus Woykebacteria bacterium RBG_16_39_9b]
MKKLLVIVGPTGTGKTDLGLKLAKKFNGELVSADSRQIYIGMDIGTGKEIESSKYDVKKNKGSWVVNGIPIHLYDVINPDKTFSVVEYQQEALGKIKEIENKGKLPILVGGTGLYVQAIVEGVNIPKVPPDSKLRAKLESKPLATLVSQLEQVDPKTAIKIDKQNPRRVIRALEVYYSSGQSFSSLEERFKVNFDSVQIGLTAPRDFLYKKVDDQIDDWFRVGFIEEVKKLISDGYDEKLPALTSLGYRQVAMYLKGNLTIEEAKQRIKWEHHGYIRRQFTWFRKRKNIVWFDISDPDLIRQINAFIKAWLVQK